MNKINLIGNLITDPFTIEPRKAKVKNRKAWKPKIKEKKKREITTMVMCGCGNHPINPKKDPYMQHNKWAAQFHPEERKRDEQIFDMLKVLVQANRSLNPNMIFQAMSLNFLHLS
jgi:hypothetical protein